MSNIKINHCLVIVGQLRTLVVDKVKSRLKEILSKYDGDVFFIIEKDDVSIKFDFSEFNPKDIKFYKYNGPSCDLTYLCSFGWYNCMELILKHEQINNQKYDLIYKSRPDLYIQNDILNCPDISESDLNKAIVWGEYLGGGSTKSIKYVKRLPQHISEIIMAAIDSQEKTFTYAHPHKHQRGLAICTGFNVMTRKACNIFLQEFLNELNKQPVDPIFNLCPAHEEKLGYLLFKYNVEKRVVHINRMIARFNSNNYGDTLKDKILFD